MAQIEALEVGKGPGDHGEAFRADAPQLNASVGNDCLHDGEEMRLRG